MQPASKFKSRLRVHLPSSELQHRHVAIGLASQNKYSSAKGKPKILISKSDN
jgi:hypothetical protein